MDSSPTSGVHRTRRAKSKAAETASHRATVDAVVAQDLQRFMGSPWSMEELRLTGCRQRAVLNGMVDRLGCLGFRWSP